MVNSKFKLCQWRQWVTTVSCFAIVCGIAADTSGQNTYQNNQHRIYSNQPAPRFARSNAPATPRITPQPFRIDVVDPPVPLSDEPDPLTTTPATPAKFSALSKAFEAGSPRPIAPTGRLQDIFGENPQEDIFGESKTPAAKPNVPSNPFQKVDPTPTPGATNQQDLKNPFGEIAPRKDKIVEPQVPGQNPFNELPSDPNLGTPPMDTNPIESPLGPGGVEPKLPTGSEFTPDPGLIQPNPPIPGEEPTPRDDEIIVKPPEFDDAPDIEPVDPEKSVFESQNATDDEIEPAPVPKPLTSKVYLPARTPADYVQGGGSNKPAYPPGLDPRMMPKNPYANLPGPYGYAEPPSFPGYVPPQNGGYAPNPYEMPYGQCGPGCVPANMCASPAAPAASCGGCNRCNTCSGTSQPVLAATGIGERIMETSASEVCATETYVDVVSDCDETCANYTSCYVGLFGGWSDLNDLTTRGDIGTGVYLEDAGYLFGATLGQIQGRNLRSELELSYRNININGMRLEGSNPSQIVGVHGDFGTLAGMLNGYWEFVDFGPEKVKPYIGGGVGFALARPNLIQSDGTEAVINDNESSFAWQWMAGLNYKASPTLDAFVEYRSFTADSFRLDTEIPEVAGLGNGSGPFDYRSGTVLFGLRARF